MSDKFIRDAVHGTIRVEECFVKSILDTKYFQRLRRIEQTSIRSLYPSARHDRFIHSLGVYHIGKKFAHRLYAELRQQYQGNKELIEELKKISQSYLIACLLHDIAHAPFSHTFEKNYGTKEYLWDRLNNGEKDAYGNRLCEGLNIPDDDVLDIDKIKEHEFASAILINERMRNVVETLGGDLELICRMILGYKYVQDHALENCYISLLNGNIYDADRLDYACRDVWASGYSTSNIDVDRIAAALHIRPKTDGGDDLVVCIDNNAMTEVFNMLEVRMFQNRYVINHHTVQYDQKLLCLAAEKMASDLIGGNGSDALQKIIMVDSIEPGIQLGGMKIKNMSDDDLIFLIKQSNNLYYEEWASREYTRFAIWKNPSEFYEMFPMVPRNQSLYSPKFEEEVKKKLIAKLKYKEDDIIISKVKYKPYNPLEDVFVCVNGHACKFQEVYPSYFWPKDSNFPHNNDIFFYYLYLPSVEKVANMTIRTNVKDALTSIMKKLYTNQN